MLFIQNYPIPLVCPRCKGKCISSETSFLCRACDREYLIRDNIPIMFYAEIFGTSGIDVKLANVHGYSREAMTYDSAMHYHLKSTKADVRRANALLEDIDIQKDGLIILEIGAGTGHCREVLSRIIPSATYCCTDISFEMLQIASRKYVAEYIVCDAEALPLPAQSVDLVVCGSFLHHLKDDEKLLKEIHRVLKVDGIFMGLREPRMGGCDFWFKFHHIAKRYGDRQGLKLLMKRILGKEGGHNKIWAYEMSDEDFSKLDYQEIRGAILHQTPTKEYGGINCQDFCTGALRHFKKCTILSFGLSTAFVDFVQILFQKPVSEKLYTFADIIDRHFFHLLQRVLPFDSFCFILRK